MPRVIEDGGSTANLSKPARLPHYDPRRVPDAVTCAGAAIIINDSKDGNPRPQLAISNGASWDRYVRADEVESLVARLVADHLRSFNPATVDATPLINQAVRDTLPGLVQRALPVLTQQQPAMQQPAEIAQALIEINAAVTLLAREVDYVKTHALADVKLTEGV